MEKCGDKGPIGLNELKQGQRARIKRVLAQGDLKLKLTELGFFAGEPVQKTLVSPLGDPAAYLVRGSITAIRNADAALVRVLPTERQGV